MLKIKGVCDRLPLTGDEGDVYILGGINMVWSDNCWQRLEPEATFKDRLKFIVNSILDEKDLYLCTQGLVKEFAKKYD